MQQHMTKTGRNASGLPSRAASVLRSAVAGFITHVSSPLLFAYGFCSKNWKHEQRIRGESPLVANG